MKKIIAILLIGSCIMISSCKVTWAPKYDSDMVARVDAAHATTDSLYNAVMVNSDKSYNTYALAYGEIQTELQDIRDLDTARVKSAKIVSVVDYIIDRLTLYQSYHSDAGNLNNSQARVFEDYMDVLFKALHNLESNLKQ